MANLRGYESGGVEYKYIDTAGRQMVAAIENTSTASAAHEAGTYLIYDDTLYEVTSAIAIGDTLTVGTNIEERPGGISGEVSELKSAIALLAITDEMKQALLACFANVAWTTPDGQEYYDALESALYENDYSVTNTLTNCSTNNNVNHVLKYTGYAATITPIQYYTLNGASISVTMGGNDVTDSVYSNGVINIPMVTGNIVIEVSAVINVPSAYHVVDYIQSTGAEYIDTGIYGDLTTRAIIDMQRITDLGTIMRFFGDRQGTANKSFFLSSVGGTDPEYIYVSVSNIEADAYVLNWTTNRVEFDISADGVYVNNTRIPWNNQQDQGPTTTFTTQSTLAIFNARNNGSYGSGMIAKLFSIKIEKSGTDVFYGVPVYRVSDDEAGLYDLVSETFFGNTSGSGAFVAGGE